MLFDVDSPHSVDLMCNLAAFLYRILTKYNISEAQLANTCGNNNEAPQTGLKMVPRITKLQIPMSGGGTFDAESKSNFRCKVQIR